MQPIKYLNEDAKRCLAKLCAVIGASCRIAVASVKTCYKVLQLI
jgi:hypothetical protein